MTTIVLNLCVVSCLAIVALQDIRTRQILPLSYPIILILSLWGGISLNSLLGGAILFALTVVIGLMGGFGGGDIKLMAVCGVYLGYPLVIPFFMLTFASYFVGYVCYLVIQKARKREIDTSCAFAPYILAGMTLTILIERILT